MICLELLSNKKGRQHVNGLFYKILQPALIQ